MDKRTLKSLLKDNVNLFAGISFQNLAVFLVLLLLSDLSGASEKRHSHSIFVKKEKACTVS